MNKKGYTHHREKKQPVIIPVSTADTEFKTQEREEYEKLYEASNTWVHHKWRSINWSYRKQLSQFEERVHSHIGLRNHQQ